MRGTPIVEGGRLCNQDYEALKAECLESGTLFTDQEFPPDDASLYFSQDPPFAFEWKRASELSEDPKLFEAGTSRFDINQVLLVLQLLPLPIDVTVPNSRASWGTAGCWLPWPT